MQVLQRDIYEKIFIYVMVKRPIIKIIEERCDGCGLCIPSCEEGAIQIVDGKARLVSESYCDGLGACLGSCPRGALVVEEREAPAFDEEAVRRHLEASPEAGPLGQWPVKLLLQRGDPHRWDGKDMLLLADCAALVHPNPRLGLIQGKRVSTACPKFGDLEAYRQRLTSILSQGRPRSLTVAVMEVPCCSGLKGLAARCIQDSGSPVPLETFTVGLDGEVH